MSSLHHWTAGYCVFDQHITGDSDFNRPAELSSPEVVISDKHLTRDVMTLCTLIAVGGSLFACSFRCAPCARLVSPTYVFQA